MSLTNYSDLQSVIADTMRRTDLGSQIPDFIRLTEARLTADFAENGLTGKLTASENITTDAQNKSLGAGYRGTVAVYLDADPIIALDYFAPNDFYRRWISVITGQPKGYTIIGDEIWFGPIPDASYTAVHKYTRMPDLASDTTNSIMTNHPNLYLNGALSEGFDFIGNVNRAQVYERRYLQALDSLESEAWNQGSHQIFNPEADAGAPRRSRSGGAYR